MLTKTEAQNLCQKVLKRSGTNDAELILMVEEDALTRFANNTIHQNVAELNLRLTLRMLAGKRSGLATTNLTDESSLDELAARALVNAETSPEDPEFIGLAEPSEYPQVNAVDQVTARH